MKFYIVDVFAEEKYTGNQLAVFYNAADISENQMQRIAKEMNYSETTFVVSKISERVVMRFEYSRQNKNYHSPVILP